MASSSINTAASKLPSWADILSTDDATGWTSLSALLTIPNLSNASKSPTLALALVSEAGKVTPWAFTAGDAWKWSPFSGDESKTASRVSTIKDAYKLEGQLRVPPDFGPAGALLARIPSPDEFHGLSDAPAIKLFFEKLKGTPDAAAAFVDTLTLSPPSAAAAGATPRITIPVHSYIFPQQKTRVFLAKAYTTHAGPAALLPYRLADLQVTRGEITSLDDPTKPEQGNYQPWQRIYQYDVYNDLGVDHKTVDPALQRPNLGGKIPYPRRIKTGRGLNPDGETEKAVLGAGVLPEPYLPMNERYTPVRKIGFLGTGLSNKITGAVNQLKTKSAGPGFESVHEVRKWFSPQPADSMEQSDAVKGIIKEVLGKAVHGFQWPSPAVMEVEIKGKLVSRPDMWRSDEEFGRQVVAGQNPVTMEAVTTLDGTAFTSANVPPELTGLARIEELAAGAVEDPARPRLFQIDYSAVLSELASSEKWEKAGIKNRAVFGSRALLYADDEGHLRPVAVELQAGVGTPKEVFTPKDGPGIWMLAKMFASAADSFHHQIYSHWLRSHAAVEPIIVASRRCLSLAHPIGRLLQKHFTYNLQINALARVALINAGGVIESTFSPSGFSMELGAITYGATWRFDRQAVPADLVARGVAVGDKSAPGGVKLIEGLDQPFATDALALWNLLYGWVLDYIKLYYRSDADVVADAELVGGEVEAGGRKQKVAGWWEEIKTQAHPDISVGWPSLDGRASLTNIATTIIWLASGYHAAINFGQYDFSGLLLNRSSLITKPFPARDSDDFKLLASGADYEEVERLVLSYLAGPADYATVLATIGLLAKHDDAEVYLGDEDPWVLDQPAVERFKRFAKELEKLEADIVKRNDDPKLVNRSGHYVVPYTLLMPSSGPGVTRRGIPNSISI